MKDLQFSDSDWLHRSSDARCVAETRPKVPWRRPSLGVVESWHKQGTVAMRLGA